MKTQPYVLDWPAKGKLAMMPRPAGGDWLADDLRSLRAMGVDTLVSALTPDDQERLGLRDEPAEAAKAALSYFSYPITDFGVPDEASLKRLAGELAAEVTCGRFVVAHCFGGVGRSGLIVGATLIALGATARGAIELMCRTRGVDCPETPEQRRMLETLAAHRSAGESV